MTQSRQTFENKTNDVLFVMLEPRCWRYRLNPGDVLEIGFSLKCRREGWIPLEVQIGSDGDNLLLSVFVNGDREPDVLLNGSAAVEDYHLNK